MQGDDGSAIDSRAESLFFAHPEMSAEAWRACLSCGEGPAGPLDPEVARDLAVLLDELEAVTGRPDSDTRPNGLAAAATDAADGSTPDANRMDALDGLPTLSLRIRGTHGSVYQLEGRVDTGAHGIVYRGRQREPFERQVAVKVYYSSFADGSEQGSLQAMPEVRAIQRLEHPGARQVFDVGLTAWNQPFLVMEFVEGRPLWKFLAEEKPSLAQRLTLFHEVLDVIVHAHAAGVVHRDIKPSNVLVHAASGRVKLIDFSIAKLTDATTEPGGGSTVCSGTRGYRSPEQAGLIRHRSDHRSDVYALGCLLYEMLTDEPAFREEDLPSLEADVDATRGIAQRLAAYGERIATEVPGCRVQGLAEVIERCVAIQPDDRLTDASELREQLDACLSGERLPRLPTRTWLRRHRRAWQRGAVAAGLIGVAAALMVTTSGDGRSLQEQVEQARQRAARQADALPPGLSTDPVAFIPSVQEAVSPREHQAAMKAELDKLSPEERIAAGRRLVQHARSRRNMSLVDEAETLEELGRLEKALQTLAQIDTPRSMPATAIDVALDVPGESAGGPSALETGAV